MYFGMKSYLKSTRNHTTKHTLRIECAEPNQTLKSEQTRICKYWGGKHDRIKDL